MGFNYKNNKLFNTKSAGGCNPARTGFWPQDAAHDGNRTGISGCNVLPNCVGWVVGRFNQLQGNSTCKFSYAADAGKFYANAGLTQSKDPAPGAIMCWNGHVAIVESVSKDGKSVTISESGWSTYYKPGFEMSTSTINKSGSSWPSRNGHAFQGFLLPPGAVVTTTTDNPLNSSTQGSTSIANHNLQMLADTVKIPARDLTKYHGMDLLSSATLVESPFIIAQIGDYTFGSYTKEGSLGQANSSMKVTYPNYMDSITINKTNGTLNTYTLNMVYQIIPGKDPNLIDRVLSTVANTRKIILSYGDWEAPSFIFQKEEAIITKVVSNIDFANQRINYTLSCTSKALQASAMTFDFPARKIKGSDLIKELIKNQQYGLLEVFPGMANEQLVADNGLIPGDDKEVEIEAQKAMDPLKYLNYVVACMSAATNNDAATIKDSTYHLIIMDDIENEYGGAYFQIKRIGTTTKNLAASDIYEVDIGFPTNTIVTGFTINTDNHWTILYDYQDKINFNNYVYSIDNNGIIKSDYVNQALVSAYFNRTTEINKTWWTRATQFPISATLTIKGLLRPAILMNYLRINTYFYGQRHISSGIYVITKQEDTINASGYRTVLSLTRIAGDEDDTIGSIEDLKSEDPNAVPKVVVASDTGGATPATLSQNKVLLSGGETAKRATSTNPDTAVGESILEKELRRSTDPAAQFTEDRINAAAARILQQSYNK